MSRLSSRICASILVVILWPGLVVAATNYVSLSGGHLPPFASWADAATNIQDAIDAAVAGDLVLVSNGTYASGARAWAASSVILSNRVVIDKPVTVQSLAGAENTAIVGAGPLGIGAIRCVAMTNGAALVGFTVSNGHTRITGDGVKEQSGGGVWCIANNARIDHCIVVGNRSDDDGGGLYRGTGTFCTFVANVGWYGGGAAQAMASHCTFVGNIAAHGGGMSQGSAFWCLFADNTASNSGGGTVGTVVHNSAFRANIAITSGGGSSGGTAYNCLYTRNRVSDVGGAADGTTLENCTVVGNRAAFAGGGVHGCTMRNSIVYHNEAMYEPNYNWANTFSYSCTIPAPDASPNNTTNDPRIATLDNPRLLPGSPCIGAGYYVAWMSNAVDMDAEGRTNGVVDMGADEMWPLALTGNIAVAIDAPLTQAVVNAPLAFTPLVDGRLIGYAWSFGDGVVATNVFGACHAYGTPGTYQVVLSAFNDSETVAATVTVQVVSGAQWYVQPGGNDGNAGTNWGTAKATIQGGVDAADVVGGTVWVNDGTYSNGWRVSPYGGIPNRVVIAKRIVVRSVNGPGSTFIFGEKTSAVYAVRCAFLENDAALVGFTLTNGQYRIPGYGDRYRDGYGGGAWCELSRGFLSNCVVIGCYAYDNAGGAYGGTFVSCVLRGNRSEYGDGGGVRYGTLDNCTVISNRAVNGGGIAWSVCRNSVLVQNIADQGGAARDSVLFNCTVASNRAGYTGGATYAGTASYCVFTVNTSPDGGAARGGYFSDCTFRNNAGNYGGAAYYGAFTNCVFSGNRATTMGGGLYSCTMYACVLTNNTGDGGGGTYSSTCYSSLIAGNTATRNGGGSHGGALYSCTLVANTALRGGGAFQGTMNNCIAYYNNAPTGANLYGITAYYACTTPLPPGLSNIVAEPGIASLDNPRLLPGSPCIGIGADQSWMTNSTDVEGEPRLNGRVDVGADELWPAALTGALEAAIVAEYTQVVAGVAVQFDAVVAGRPDSIAWDFGDGTAATNSGIVRHAFGTAGVFTVTLIAANLTMAATASVAITVLQEANYYVATEGSDANHGTNWLAPKATIQAAVDSAPPGAVVWVSNGVYASGTVSNWPHGCQLPSRVAVTKPMTVRGLNGAEGTVICGRGPVGLNAVRGVYLCGGAVLHGVTISNGHTFINVGDSMREMAGAGVWAEEGAVVSQCVFTANRAREFGGGLYGGSVAYSAFENNAAEYGCGGGAARATIDSCRFSGNTVSGSDGGGAYESIVVGSIFNSNYAYNGGGVAASKVVRCQIGGNAARYSGGGTYDCEVWNCVVSNNYAENVIGEGAGVCKRVAVNTLIVNNLAQKYGGGAAHAVLVNCTVASNTASLNSGGVYLSYLTNCIVYHNFAPVNTNSSAYTAINSCVWPLPSGRGNVSNDPQFINLDGADFHLAEGSPCIGTGTNLGWLLPPSTINTDLDGQPRAAYGTNDMGAYEYVAGLWCDFLASPTQALVGQSVQFSAEVAGTNRTTVSYLWDADNAGLAETQGVGLASFSHAFAVGGVYSPRLAVSNAAGEGVGCLRQDYIRVIGPGLPFVDITNDTMTVNFTVPLAVAGTNNADVCGLMWISNAANDQAASFTAMPSWISAPISLIMVEPYTNVIHVYGTNMLGHVASDTVTVVGVPEPAGLLACAIILLSLGSLRSPRSLRSARSVRSD